VPISDLSTLSPYELALHYLTVRASADVDRLIEQLAELSPEEVIVQLRAAFPELVNRYGAGAAALAVEQYDEMRAAAGVVGTFRSVPAPPDERAAGAVRRLAGMAADGDLAVIAPGLRVVADRLLKDRHRDTIATNSIRDPRARGWQRVTHGVTCAFCRMLAGRGGVYTKASATFASHNACDCTAQPEWDPHAPDVPVEAYVASVRTSAMTDAQREQHRARVRDYLLDYED
jgi:hypothetical protein